jgi:hypothetical protein
VLFIFLRPQEFRLLQQSDLIWRHLGLARAKMDVVKAEKRATILASKSRGG